MAEPQPFESERLAGAERGLERGERVEVRTRFEGGWVGGFEVSEVDRDGLRVRRRSDGYEIPRRFGADDIRPQD